MGSSWLLYVFPVAPVSAFTSRSSLSAGSGSEGQIWRLCLAAGRFGPGSFLQREIFSAVKLGLFVILREGRCAAG